MFLQMDKARDNCRIPTELVPKCPVCGGRMNMNLRSNNFFVEDENWKLAEERFGEYLQKITDGKRVVLLELGVGFNTPTIIRFSFENLMKKYPTMNLVRLNLNEAIIPENICDRDVGINADMKESIRDLYEIIHSSM